MLSGEKILVTGPAGQIAFPLCQALAKNNEVWGIARFSKAGSRERVEGAGITTRAVDLASGDFGDLPNNFSYVLHIAASIESGSLDYDSAFRTNAEGTGLLLAHCRKAKAAMVMSSFTVYKPNPDPMYAYVETDPLGDSNLPAVPTYSMSKIAEEGVARTCARIFNLPTVIARMGSAYGGNGGLPFHHLDTILAGKPVTARWDPHMYCPIHERDIFDQLEPILAAASVPATIVNWNGDIPVSVQEMCTYFGELLGINVEVVCKPVPNTKRGGVSDNTKRIALTGPCRVHWRDGFREAVKARRPEVMLKTGS